MSGDLVRCRQGHVFDLAQHAACPVCGEGIAKAQLAASAPVDKRRRRGDATDKSDLTLTEIISRPALLAGAAAGAALLGLTIVLLWPAPTPTPMPPHQGGEKQARNDADKKKSGEVPPRPVKHENENTPAPAPPAPAPGPGKQASLENPPKPVDDGLNVDFRDPLARAFEEKYAFTPLARELLATTRGYVAYTRKDYWKAKSWFTTGAAKGNPAAVYWYAVMLENGQGVQQDYAAALSGITAAAEAGLTNAQLRLAQIYIKGEYPSVPADPGKGRMWLIKAAKEGRADASRFAAEIGLKESEIGASVMTLDHALGRSFQDAFAVAQTLSADKTTSGYFWTGTLTFYGQGTKADKDSGRDLIAKAARLYCVPALVDLAHWSADGFKTSKNPMEAAAIAYLARFNAESADEVQRVDKVLAPLVAELSSEQYQELGILMKDIIELPRRGAR